MKSRNFGLLAITLVPSVLIGALLWWLGGLVPECRNTELSRLTSPDASTDVVAFSRDCGTGGSNTQAATMPAGEGLDVEANAFLAIEGTATPVLRWDGFGNIEVTLPPDAEIVRQEDEVAGIAIIYR